VQRFKALGFDADLGLPLDVDNILEDATLLLRPIAGGLALQHPPGRLLVQLALDVGEGIWVQHDDVVVCIVVHGGHGSIHRPS
jgi:hypothetical protein